jgi:dihydroxy-acid dehydratase
MTNTPPKRGLARNTANYGDRDFALYLRRSFAKSMGYSQAMLDKPVVGIVDTGSDYNNCHRTVPELIEAVKRGVLAAGGLPLAFPTVSLCEPSLFPCSMHYRNLAAIDTEAMLTAQPMDAAVLIGGCDKTVPAQLMAAASATFRRCNWSPARCSPPRSRASASPPAPIAAGTGLPTAPAP